MRFIRIQREVNALYFIVYFTVLVLAASDLKKIKFLNEFFATLICIFFIFIVGLRYNSVDYDSYVDIYNRSDLKNFSFPLYNAPGGSTGNEFIYATLNAALNGLGLDVVFLFLIVAAISIGVKFYFFKKISPYFFISVLLFLSFSFFKELGQIRSALASAILLFSIKPMINGNIGKFIFVVMMAFGIQAYAIIALPVYFLYRFFNRNYIVYFLLCFAFLVSLLGGISQYAISFFDGIGGEIFIKAKNYFSSYDDAIHYHALNLSCLFFAFVLYFYRDVIGGLNKAVSPLIFFHVYATIIYFMTMDFPIMASRTIEMFSFTSLAILLPFLAKIAKNESRVLIILGLILYSILLFYAASQSAEPYQNILWELPR